MAKGTQRGANPFATAPRLFRGLAATIAATSLVAGVLVAPAAAATKSAEGVSEIARFRLEPPENRSNDGDNWRVRDVDLVLDPGRRRAYVMYGNNIEFASGPPARIVYRTQIQSFDLDTRKKLGETLIEHRPQLSEEQSPQKGSWLRALDQETGLLYMGSVSRKVVEDGNNVHHFPGDITVLDGSRIERGTDPVVARLRAPQEFEPRLATRTITGLRVTRDPEGAAKLMVLYSPPSGGGGLTAMNVPLLAQMDAATGAIDWSLDLEGCARGTLLSLRTTWVPIVHSADGRRVYTICNTQQRLAAVVRVDLDRFGRPAAGAAPAFYPGPSDVDDAIGDDASERILATSVKFGGHTLWVFDGTVSKYVGAVGLTQEQVSITYGIDERRGRLYIVIPDHVATATGGEASETGSGGRLLPVQGGLFTVDFRLTPTPQAINVMPSLSYPAQPAVGVDPDAADGITRVYMRKAFNTEPTDEGYSVDNIDQMRVYPTAKITNYLDEPFYRVVDDAIPPADPVSFADADRLTVDVAEAADETVATFDASGSAYGVRAQLVGGIGAALRAHEDNENVIRNAGHVSPCWYRDRDVVMGWVRETHLTDLQTEAQASGFDVDPTSRADLDQTFSRCPPPSAPKQLPSEDMDDASDALWELLGGRPWETETAECSGDGVGRQPDATVRCSFGDGSAKGEASWSGIAVPGISVGYGWSRTTVARDARRGVVVTSEALARAIAIEDVTIDLVRSVAESWSNGRPSDGARTSLVRTICGVRTPAYAQEQCADPAEAIAAINTALRGRLEVYMPEPDPRFARGSERGYVAGVTKNAADAEEDKLINRDFHREVPGLRIIGYRDTGTFGPGRQIVELAGVRAVTTYGIQCLSPRVYDAGGKACVMPEGQAIPPFEPGPQPTVVGPPVVSEPDVAPVPDAGPLPQPPPVVRAIRDFLVRTFSEGVLAAGIWFLLGLPFLLTWRRGALARAIGRNA